MKLVPPSRSQNITTKAQRSTARLASWMEAVSRQINDSAEVFGLGTAAVEDVGTQPGNVVQLDSSARLPPVDGSQLTGIPAGPPGPTGPPGASALLPPETLTFTYNPDGTVLNISGATTDLDFTYLSGLVDTIDDQTNLRTFNYNVSNQLTSIVVS